MHSTSRPAEPCFDVAPAAAVILSGVWTLYMLAALSRYYCQAYRSSKLRLRARHGSAEIGSAVLIGDT